jgi:CRISPR-associated protein Csx17
MTIYEQVLDGCPPVPLASYLKALGVFRLVAEQADPQARGFWRDERFVLRTSLAQEELVRFFVDRYEPSPIISPWNGRAGFLEGEEEGGERSSRQGAQLVRRYETAGKRFWKLRGAVETYRSSGVIKALDRARAEEKSLRDKGRKVPPTEEEKARLKALGAEIKRYKSSAVGDLRSDGPDWTIDWFDSCKRIGANEADMPLLGTGGNDGSRDFGMNFGAALSELYDFDSGLAHPHTSKLVNESLGFEALSGLGAGNLGLYEPGGAGENTTSGFVGEQPSNPFDFVVLLEGAMLFSGVTTRRLGSGEARLSFPFTVKALTAGSGAAKAGDDQSFAEFWAPLWTRPARLDEIQAFLAEGRTAVNGKTARDGLEFAVAVGTLGSQRGVAEFQRFALLQREPQNPKKATPLGRIRVRENPRASLIAELDKYDWLTRTRRLALDKAGPASLVRLGRALDEALFRQKTVRTRPYRTR